MKLDFNFSLSLSIYLYVDSCKKDVSVIWLQINFECTNKLLFWMADFKCFGILCVISVCWCERGETKNTTTKQSVEEYLFAYHHK